jgi:hypothetical protein
VWNNRFVGGAMLGAIVYANVTPWFALSVETNCLCNKIIAVEDLPCCYPPGMMEWQQL